MVTLTALTGLRIGEVLGLRWRALDFVAGTIRVSESVFLGQFQKPKSEKSHRTIPIGPVLERLLENHRQWSIAPSPDKLVFQNLRGGPHRESNLLNEFSDRPGRRQELGG
jgi:integrase